MTLGRELVGWVAVRARTACPRQHAPDGEEHLRIVPVDTARRLMDLGLGYLALDRAGATLSTGERQRVQLARAVRNRTTGVLYVLDEPSIGLHPSNIDGLTRRDARPGGRRQLRRAGRPRRADAVRHPTGSSRWGRAPARDGGHVIAQGTVERSCAANPAVADRAVPVRREGACRRAHAPAAHLFAEGRIRLSTGPLHTVQPLDADIPEGPAGGRDRRVRLRQDHAGAREPDPRARGGGRRPRSCPSTCARVDAEGISQVRSSSTPRRSAANVRSTVATYANVHDELRKRLRPHAGGQGERLDAPAISPTTPAGCAAPSATAPVDHQLWTCSSCPTWTSRAPPAAAPAMRPTPAAMHWQRQGRSAQLTLPQLMAMSVDTALGACREMQARHASGCKRCTTWGWAT